MRLAPRTTVAAQSRRGKSHRAGRRQRLGRIARRRALSAGAAAAAFVAVPLTVYWLASSGEADRLSSASGRLGMSVAGAAGFTVERVLVSGRNRIADAELQRILAVAPGMPILAFDPQRARSDLLELGWVKAVRVSRRLPGTIYIDILERQPLAIWQRDGALALIDRDGIVITREDLARFTGLPQVVGPGAEHAAAGLVDALAAFPELRAAVRAAVRVSERRWDLVMVRGTRVRLPEGDVAAALTHLAGLQREQRILDQDIVSIDLRLPDRLVVRLPEESDAGTLFRRPAAAPTADDT